MTTNKESLPTGATGSSGMVLQYEDVGDVPQWDQRAAALQDGRPRLSSRVKRMWYSYFTATSRRRTR